MLFYLDDNNKADLKKVKRTTLANLNWTEKDLEDLIASNISRVISEESLMTIFQERKGKEEPDILALDKHGNLYILELKRWQSDRENLLQVLRYGQIFGKSKYSQLETLYRKHTGDDTSCLLDDHRNKFDLRSDERLEEKDFNRKQVFLIVTDGTDIDTREAVNYWRSTGLLMEAIIYRVYLSESNDKIIEFEAYTPECDEIEFDDDFYILNTNYNNHADDDADMLKNAKAAAYYAPWKNNINKIKKGNKVFLYRSGTGIVAMGIGSGIIEKREYNGDSDEEHFTRLNNFKALKKPLTANDIKQIANNNYVFRPTMFGIDEESGNALWDYIEKNCL